MTTSFQLHSHRDYTIGWVCALRKEQTAATAMLDAIHDELPNPPKDPNAYTLGSIGKHNIVIACLPEGKYGTNAAATAATWIASTFPSVRFGLMVGIGGGIPSNKIRLGDVVVSKPDSCFPGVIQWDFGKIEQGGTIEHTGSLNNPPTALLTSLAKLGTKKELEGSHIPNHLADMEEKWPTLAAKYTRLESLRDILFADDCPHIESLPTDGSPREAQTYNTETEEEEEEEEAADCRFCDMTKARKRKPRATRIHYGLIASGNMVIKDAQFRNQLSERFSNKILCVEMEAAGLMNDFPCLVIRGISDYADSHKNKAWQEYAAAVAAAFAKELLLVVPIHAVEQMDTITSILSDIRGDVRLAVGYLEEVSVHRHNQEDEKILEWLSTLDYGAEHSDILKRWQPGTGQWLLKSAEFNEFIETTKQVMFCPGIPGAGKTVMTATVIDFLHNRFSNDSTIGIAYIYFNFKRQSDQTPDAVFSSLLKQVARQQPSLHQSVKILHKIHTKNCTRPPWREILTTFQDVVRTYSRVFVVIDALDECTVINDCRETILSEIMACIQSFNLKLFTTSRHIPEISDRFQAALNLEIGTIESDIRTYIDSRLFKLAPTSVISQSKALQENIKTGIQNAAGGMFLLAQLHFDRLTDCITPKAVRKTLNDFSTGSDAYDHAYNAAMDRINQQGSSRRQLAMNVLSWITHAKRPLSVAELQHALGVEIGEDELDEDNLPQIEDIVSTSVGLVNIDEKSKVIRLVHYTTQEYFERTRGKWFPNAETYIAEVCSSYLSYSAFESGCCIDHNDYINRMNLFKFYKYAAENWRHHVTASQFSQRHIKFLRKASNLAAFLQASQIEDKIVSDCNSYGYLSSEFPSVYLYIEHVTSLHIAAGSGWNVIVEILLREMANSNLNDSYHFLRRFDDVDVRDSCNRSPFYMAARGGYDTIMNTLFNSGQVDVNVITISSGCTPLIRAAQGGHIAAVKWLLDTGKVNMGFKCRGKVALWYAAVGGHVDTVQLLVDPQNYDPDMVREIYSSALLGAVLSGKETIINLLLETGYADVNVQTSNSYLPFSLHHAVHDMIEKDYSTTAYSINQSKTPLCLAIELGHETLVKLFLGMEEVDIDLKTEYGAVALSIAADKGRANIFQLLLNSGRFDMNCKDSLEQTPLMIAASNGHKNIVELLLDNDTVSIDWRDKNGRTALFLATESYSSEPGKTSVAKLLIGTGKANINTKDENGVPPLWNAMDHRNESMAKLLLESQGIDTTLVDERGETTLLRAVCSAHEGIVKYCLGTGRFDINVRDHSGATPLIFGAKSPYQSPNLIRLLLASDKIDVNAKDYIHNKTALLWAAYSGSLENFTILLQTGAFNINERDSYGFTAFIIAIQECRKATIQFLFNTPGVDYYTRDYKHKRTALLWAAYAGNLEIFTALLQTGIFNVNERDSHGFTAFIIAIQEGREAIIQELLNTPGVDYYTRDYKHRRTALLWAAYAGNLEIFTALLQTGKFDVNERDKYGIAPLAMAAMKDNTPIVEFLLDICNADHRTKSYRHGRTALMWASYCGSNRTVANFLLSGKYDAKEVDVDGLDSIALAMKQGHHRTVEILQMNRESLYKVRRDK